jgi:two-component system response regulator RegA
MRRVTSVDNSPLGLLVDDDQLFLSTLQRSLQKRGVRSVLATSVAEALGQSMCQPLDYALVDLRIGAGSGLELIEPLRRSHREARIILITGYASIATAVEAMKRGADDYLLKPTTADAIARAIRGERAAEVEPQSTLTPLSRLEWEHIHRALTETGGNVSAAARLLGMHRRSLQRKLAKRPSPEGSPDNGT